MMYLFSDANLLTVIVGCFFAGFLPLFLIILMTPEARSFIKYRMSGGLMVDSTDDSNQTEYVVAKPYGPEGQYIGGRDKFGRRRIFVKPRTETGIMTKISILKGLRRPIVRHYAGKTVITSTETLAAIEVTEAMDAAVAGRTLDSDEVKNKLVLEAVPKPIIAWAKSQNILIKEPDSGVPLSKAQFALQWKANLEAQKWYMKLSEEDRVFVFQISLAEAWSRPQFNPIKETRVSLFSMDPRKLREYFSSHYEESQYDVLLEQKRIEGQSNRPQGKGGSNKTLIIVIIIALALAAVVLVTKGLKLW